MGLLTDLFNTNNKSSSVFSKLEDNDLDDYQKELIKKDDYDASNFEEEDLEDDDYYYEDSE
ncbi:MAG: hypothetical protein IKF19_05590 [Bacilli bacterium]|nr:hypothetical protein [Bacilli bacterium]